MRSANEHTLSITSNPTTAMARRNHRTAPKRPTNLSIDGDLLKAAREAGVNLSAALEEALLDKVNAKRRERWVLENKDAIAAYNAFVNEHGAFSDESRAF
jgi:antitoxin CcdA